MRKTVIGVMGPGADATKRDIENAQLLGELIAKKGWAVLSGGRNTGVMDAVSKGAKGKKGLTIGILPDDDKTKFSEALDVVIVTNMRSGRNYINVLSSDIIIACGMNSGTASEIALALQSQKPIILLSEDEESKIFFKKLGGNLVHLANNPKEAIPIIEKLLENQK